MTILFWLLVIIAIYFFLVFVGLRLVVPFMGFGRFRLPHEIPQEIKNKIVALENSAADQSQYLEAAYNLVISKWHAGRMNTVLLAPLAFRTNLLKIWNAPGFAHCNTQNYMLFVLLAGSKYFTDTDVLPRCVMFNLFIHQYLKVKVGERIVDVDPAGASIRGLPLGTHIEWFG